MTPPGTTLRNLRVADECTLAAIFEKSRTKELRILGDVQEAR